jgi:hypothetical protein
VATTNRNRSLEIFHELFDKHLDHDDYLEFYSNRNKDGTKTFLRSDVYTTEKLSAVIVEEYSIKSKMGGNVIVVLPRSNFDVPVFTFQLGGSDNQSIALLDISPTLPGMDYSPLLETFEKYRKILNIEAPKVEWVKSISSPYLLHCQYGELDEDVFMDALRDYLEIWIEHYYLPGKELSAAADIEKVTNAVYKYKHVLHSNDPAYGIFAKAWGKPVADAFFYIETHQYPPLPVPDHDQSRLKIWKDTDRNILWTREAQEYVYRAPETVHALIRKTIEDKAAAASIGIITVEILEHYSGSGPAPDAA